MAQEALIVASSTANAVLLGLIPTVLWLWFWLKEDPHPEPRRILLSAFLAGIAVVPAALFAEKVVFDAAVSFGFARAGEAGLVIFLIWAGVEEYAKYFAARWAALRKPDFDEPIDAPIYLITAAVGFAALENILFLFRIFMQAPELGIATGEMRFLGATLLHIITSAVIGISIALSFFHKENRSRNIFCGWVIATSLHAMFNLSIMNNKDGNFLETFIIVWLAGVAVFLLFEKIKKIT